MTKSNFKKITYDVTLVT